MAWPQTVDYNSAVQNPADCFRDEELAHGQPAEGMIPGIPLSFAGNFATVYKIKCPTGVWAVKCFTRKVENLQLRYQQISEHSNIAGRVSSSIFNICEEACGSRSPGIPS